MIKYILTHRDSETDIPLAWEFLPESSIELINREYIFNVLSFSPEEGVTRKTMVFLKRVDAFKRGTKKIELGEGIVLGI